MLYRYSILIILQVCIYTFSFSQVKDIAITRVFYDYVHVVDTTMPDKPDKLVMLLRIGKVLSQFSNYDFEQRQIAMKKFLENNPEVKSGGLTLFYGAPFSFYLNEETKKLSSISLIKGNSYATEEVLTKPTWTVALLEILKVAIHKFTIDSKVGQNLSIKTMGDYFYNLPFSSQANHFIFIDAAVVYKFNKLKTDIDFSFNNILGASQLTTTSTNINAITENSYLIRPRMILIKAAIKI